MGTYTKIVLCVIAVFVCTSCGRTDQTQQFSPPPDELFIPLGEWGSSGGYRFRIVKVEDATSLTLVDETLKAPAGTRFVALTVDVLPVQSEKDSINYLSVVSLANMEGKGYVASEGRFTEANGGPPEVIIEPARFVERTVPFLVPKDFTPAALRCVGAPGAQPCWLALRRKG